MTADTTWLALRERDESVRIYRRRPGWWVRTVLALTGWELPR